MARKKVGRFTTADVVHYLRKENAYLKRELTKMTDLCTKLAGNITNNNVPHSVYPLNVKEQAPQQYSPDTPPHIPQLTTGNSDFILPRRVAKPCRRLQNSWEPSITLTNSFSPLATEIECAEEGNVTTTNCEETIEMRADRPSKEQAHSNGKRPTITTTEQELRNFVPIIPGRRSYANTTKGREVLVIGSSMLSRIRKKEFSEHVRNGESQFKVFPGATVNKINYYLLPELREFGYKKVVIHCGTNDLFDRTAEEIVNSMGKILKRV